MERPAQLRRPPPVAADRPRVPHREMKLVRYTALFGLLVSTSAHAQNAKSARQFIAMVSAHEAAATASAFDFRQVMTPSLMAMVDKDRGTHGQVGKLDFDPLCD